MNRYPINSANIVSIGYDETTETLEIEFKLKILHHYIQVPLDEFIFLMKSSNTEKYFVQFIQNKYHFDTL